MTGEHQTIEPQTVLASVANGLGGDVVARVERLSCRFLADAEAVDGAERVPDEHLVALAGSGFYGIFAPTSDGGLGLDEDGVCAVVEDLASACLASTFVWVQHLRFLGAMLDPATPAALRAAFCARAIRGETKAGVALTGLMPGPARLMARRRGDGWIVTGEAPWVSGWDIVDVVVVVARCPGDAIVTLLLDARPQPGLSVTPGRLSAANATRTVRLGFEDLFVAGDRVIGEQPYKMSPQTDRLRLNGSFALGVARRCGILMGPLPARPGAERMPASARFGQP